MSKRSLPIVLVASLSAFVAHAQEEPDLNRETRFHQIYKNYNEQPTSEESWSKALSGRNAQTYGVQGGDTLWDISNTFFGDPQYWPKIWSLNKNSILNPHEIGSNMSISFFPGSTSDAPTLDLAQNSSLTDPDVKVDEVAAAPAEVSEDGVALPASKKKRAKVLKSLPGSLPNLNMGGISGKRAPVEIELPRNNFPQALAHLSYFIEDAPIVGIGAVTETEMDLKSAMDFQYITVKFNANITPEKYYMIQKNRGPIADIHKKGRQGFMVEIQGSVEILERVNQTQPIYRAMVRKAIEQVEVGSLLVPGSLPMIDVKAGSVSAGVSARIIGGQYSVDRKVMGDNTLVFLDSGSSQGVQDGQTLQVFADQRVRSAKTSSLINDRAIGLIKVVRLTPNFATAYVIKSDLEFLPGDYVGHSESQSAKEASMAPATADSIGGGGDDFDLDSMDTTAPVPAESGPTGGDDGLELEL